MFVLEELKGQRPESHAGWQGLGCGAGLKSSYYASGTTQKLYVD